MKIYLMLSDRLMALELSFTRWLWNQHLPAFEQTALHEMCGDSFFSA